MHELYVGIGSNLGDRQANLLAALQRLRTRAEIFAVSGFYESYAAGGAPGPAYLNVAAGLRCAQDREAFERFARDVELAVGRAREARRLEPRPIDIDILVFDGKIVQRELDERPYDAVPLREIAPQFVAMDGDEGFAGWNGPSFPNRSSIRTTRGTALLASRRRHRSETRGASRDRGTCERLQRGFLDGRRRGAGSRRRAYVAVRGSARRGDAGRLADTTQPARIERLAETIARAIVEASVRQRRRAAARAFALERWTPVSGKRGEETYVLAGMAHAGPNGTRRVVGVEAQGMTACPCAQGMMREHWMHELIAADFSESKRNARSMHCLQRPTISGAAERSSGDHRCAQRPVVRKTSWKSWKTQCRAKPTTAQAARRVFRREQSPPSSALRGRCRARHALRTSSWARYH